MKYDLLNRRELVETGKKMTERTTQVSKKRVEGKGTDA